MISWLNRAVPHVGALIGVLEERLAPLADLLIRLALFLVFFQAGIAKLGDWPGTLALFHTDYQLPLLPPDFAAVMAASDELLASLLVLIGLGARLAALPLLSQALVIQYGLGPAYHSSEHLLWLVLLMLLIARGPGRISLDHIIRRRLLEGNGL